MGTKLGTLVGTVEGWKLKGVLNSGKELTTTSSSPATFSDTSSERKNDVNLPDTTEIFSDRTMSWYALRNRTVDECAPMLIM